MLFVPLHGLHVLAGDALLTAQTTNPSIESLESTCKRFELADLTTTMAALYGVIEEVDALFAYHALHLAIVREEHFQLDAVSQVGLVDELVCLREETACVECKNTSTTFLDNDVRQRLIFNAERR